MLDDHGVVVAELDPAWWWLPGASEIHIDPRYDSEEVFRFGEDELFALAEAVGARSLNAVDVFGGSWAIDAAAEAFARLCERAAEHGLLVHLEWLPWSKIPDLATALEIVQQAGAPNGGLNVDAWHLVRSGGDPEDLAQVAGDLILAVQLDDGPAEAEENLVEATLHHRALPGDGEFDLVGLIRALASTGTTAPLGVEVFCDELQAAAGGRGRAPRRRGHAPGVGGRDPMSGVVVFGSGFGCLTHVRALQAAGFEVMALVGRDPAKTAERAGMFGIPRALTSRDEALALDGVDAVTIATPPLTHSPIALAAIAAGKHVLCEKPFARDAAEGRAMLAAVEDAGVVHLLGCEFRWDPGQALLARAVQGGEIGEPRMATVMLQVPMLADPAAEVPDWWADANQRGGWMAAHGSQIIDQIRVTLGEFDTVSASLPHIAERGMTADDAFIVHFRMRSGAVGTLQSTASDWGPPIVITRIVGSKGTAWIEGVGATVRVADGSGTRTLPVTDDLPTESGPPLPDGLVHTAYERMTAHGMDFGPYTRLAEVLKARIDGRPDPPGPSAATFVDGVRDIAVLDAVRRSATEGTTVAVEDGLG